MASAVKMEFSGHKELKKAFNRLPLRVMDKVMKSAIQAGANPIVKQVRTRTPVELGILRRNIAARSKVYKRDGNAVAVIGARSRVVPVSRDVRWTKTGSVQPSKYLHLVNYGTANSRGGRFIEAGFRAGASSSKRRFALFLGRGIVREGRKLGLK